ncbi:hypothetical protein V1517DRAFT_310948 [Lipomyces orientalis]|uniref:Uncharacterized protein n=1 Tax=Lipomyces orientalis TaxID=1233043 RepID=A0ACC3TEA6_9ASCO
MLRMVSSEELKNLCQGVKTPRKLDVQNLRASIKNIQRNLNLFPKICQSLNVEMATVIHWQITRLNDYNCLQIITSDLLLETGRYVHSNGSFEKTKEYSITDDIIHQATRSIHAAVPEILHRPPPEPRIMTAASKLSQPQQNWIRDTLWSIRSNGFIPRASALAQSQRANAKWTDVIAGLLLVHLATSGELLLSDDGWDAGQKRVDIVDENSG